jgi:hypothetical protein
MYRKHLTQPAMTPNTRRRPWMSFLAGFAIGLLIVMPAFAAPFDVPASLGVDDVRDFVVILAVALTLVIIVAELAIAMQATRRLRPQRIKREGPDIRRR